MFQQLESLNGPTVSVHLLLETDFFAGHQEENDPGSAHLLIPDIATLWPPAPSHVLVYTKSDFVLLVKSLSFS